MVPCFYIKSIISILKIKKLDTDRLRCSRLATRQSSVENHIIPNLMLYSKWGFTFLSIIKIRFNCGKVE